MLTSYVTEVLGNKIPNSESEIPTNGEQNSIKRFDRNQRPVKGYFTNNFH